ncbi:MAG: bifunctional adenosylcobinamide kinase/adenosylcobinamide-phosphate guanylyltransferase [Saccharospirillaceae bacterium]|nr:bifunctional adenosylcobinamide kinase/adenosylcobinamide-phosphate guanylyltransferase [Saccharospirillaceae bacterium]MCD8532719.1 bifunctional adenosylcobinamide kinase/adenosylcobinamide-phosphate guanylyltransferase [Saccharospirillaceae bacterium]
MGKLELILGGARSGKSRYAEAQAAELAGEAAEVVYIATAQALDGEMQQRIMHHREQRPAHWLTLEEPLQLAVALQRVRQEHPAAVILVDCLTLWLTNCLLCDQSDDWERQKAALLDELQRLQQPLLLVSNEVGYGIVPMGELSRRFVDEAGRLHQDIARLAHDVTLVVAGIPMAVKRG